MIKITLIPGDGIGPEVIEASKICVEATGLNIEWEKFDAGEVSLKKYGTLFEEGVFESIKRNKVALKGPIITPVGGGYRSLNVLLRQKLNLYACVRPAKFIEGVPSSYKDVDIVVIRENTEGLYKGVEFEVNTPSCKEVIEKLNALSENKISLDSGISIKPISISAASRIIRFAFKFCMDNGRKKLTCVHKANIMKYTDGLFLKIFYEIAKEFPAIQAQDVIVDNLCMQLVKKPQNFDCLVLPNLYGDIVSDLCAGLVGGLGVAPGANIGDDIGVFEPVHGAAPKYAGKDKVNPTACILSAVLMLKFLGKTKEATALEKAVCEVIKEGKYVTYDIKLSGEPVGTLRMAEEIAKRVKEFL